MVIVVITVLAALLLPGLARARFLAKNTLCKSGLRQIGIALQMYAAEYEFYPPVFQHVGGNGETSTQLMWDQYLEPILFPGRDVQPYIYASGMGKTRKVDKLFLCPLFPAQQADRPFDASILRVPPIYGYNSDGVGDHLRPFGLGSPHSLYWLMYPGSNVAPSTRESAVKVPAGMIAVGDSFTRGAWPQQDGLFRTTGNWKPHYRNSEPNQNVPAKSRATLKNHGWRLNRLFCDGHLEVEDFRRPFVAADDYLRRWNYDHEPHREDWESSY